MDPAAICEGVLDKAQGGLDGLAPWERVVVIVMSAQGAIDNGGYRYFFENDWPESLAYAEFARAYRAIGCDVQASDLERVVGTFGFSNAHLKVDLRRAYIQENSEPEVGQITGWGDSLVGDETVWESLHSFAAEHYLAG